MGFGCGANAQTTTLQQAAPRGSVQCGTAVLAAHKR